MKKHCQKIESILGSKVEASMESDVVQEVSDEELMAKSNDINDQIDITRPRSTSKMAKKLNNDLSKTS